MKSGTKLTWTNRDAIPHTVTSGTPSRPTGVFDGTLNGGGATYTVTLAKRGVYPYFCRRHNVMRGEIRVTG